MKKQLRQAVTLYESFREARPRKLAKLRVNVPSVVACMGHVEGLDYRTTHKGKTTLYHHDFAAGSRPLLCVSSDGKQLMLLGGLYKWTDRGIVDRDKQGRERPDPKHGRAMNPKRGKSDQRWKVWHLGHDSDPNERYIVVTDDGENEVTGIIETEAEAQRIVDKHNATLKRQNPTTPARDMSAVQLLKALQDAHNRRDGAALLALGAEQVRREKLHHPVKRRNPKRDPADFAYKGARVQLHTATSEWMQGDRYGVVTGRGKSRQYYDKFTGKTVMERPYLVKLDKSGRTVRLHPEAIYPTGDYE